MAPTLPNIYVHVNSYIYIYIYIYILSIYNYLYVWKKPEKKDKRERLSIWEFWVEGYESFVRKFGIIDEESEGKWEKIWTFSVHNKGETITVPTKECFFFVIYRERERAGVSHRWSNAHQLSSKWRIIKMVGVFPNFQPIFYFSSKIKIKS